MLQWVNRMRPDRLAAALRHDRGHAAFWLDRMDRQQTAMALATSEPRHAAAFLEHVHTGTAVDLMQRLSTAPREWLGEMFTAMPDGLLAALVARIDLEHADAARPLRAALPAGWQPPSTGWPPLDAIRIMLTIAGPAAHRLSAQFRGTTPLSAALTRAARDARTLWHGLRQQTATNKVDYRRQRNHLALALAVTLVALIVAIVVDADGSASEPTAPLSSGPPTSVNGLRQEHAGLPAVWNYRADWPERDCRHWTRDSSTVLDATTQTSTDGILRLSCELKTAPGVELALVWYPPTDPPGGDRFTGRPTSVGAYEIVTKGNSPSDWPRWSTTKPTDTRHGTYLKYFPDKGRTAIWLEEQATSVALIIFGPRNGGDVTTQLQTILNEHGYRLD